MKYIPLTLLLIVTGNATAWANSCPGRKQATGGQTSFSASCAPTWWSRTEGQISLEVTTTTGPLTLELTATGEEREGRYLTGCDLLQPDTEEFFTFYEYTISAEADSVLPKTFTVPGISGSIVVNNIDHTDYRFDEASTCEANPDLNSWCQPADINCQDTSEPEPDMGVTPDGGVSDMGESSGCSVTSQNHESSSSIVFLMMMGTIALLRRRSRLKP